eukprot:CAMPEP_0174303918 /NCGR_PEP_ID=MMETSP0809-20121228/60470_1 /TAXON_ID=73025 ORGANISM="Eutreptiella gymnastica-like, Strain CCMP1594" /NCGR_SAMPLE_ID=MMETSP0809 /ASSEMBLY_ACC=CAM_ASM_000658 /LENGTH=54 /DNA_ID=CAMNT_0015410033 /DNA_START=1615 /DNA_END=1779 /DNA_ORIENTATION=+
MGQKRNFWTRADLVVATHPPPCMAQLVVGNQALQEENALEITTPASPAAEEGLP